MLRALALILGAALVAGCDAGASDDAPADDGLAMFAMSEAATVLLEDDGTPEKMFTRIDARRLPDGSIVVADAGSAAIHVFARDGGVVRRLARRGGGPGELQGEVALAVRGDTVLALGRLPFSRDEITVYAADAGYVRRDPPPTAGVRPVTMEDALASGALLVRRGSLFQALTTPLDPAVLRADSITYGVAIAGEDSVTWLPSVRRGWSVVFPWAGGPIPHSSAPFPQRGGTHVAASGDRVWVVDGESGSVRAFDAAGREVASSRLPLEPVPHDAAALDRRRDSELRGATRALDSARIRAQWGSDHRPATAPLAAEAHGDSEGGVWIRLWDADVDAPQSFLVLDRDGRAVARATVPAGLDVQHVGRDFVLGVRRDSLGVEAVHEHSVRRP